MIKRDPNKVFDELLVMQYQNGDERALELLVKRWNKKIMAYAFRIQKIRSCQRHSHRRFGW